MPSHTHSFPPSASLSLRFPLTVRSSGYSYTVAERLQTPENCQDTKNRLLHFYVQCCWILFQKKKKRYKVDLNAESHSGGCASWTHLLLLFANCAFTVIASEVMRAPSGYDVKQKSLTWRTDTSKAFKEWKQNKTKPNEKKKKNTMNWQIDLDRELRKAGGIRSHNMGFPTANSQSERFN